MSTGPKYQVFISSTYEDLKEERDQVVKAVLEMGHIPVGMEMFSAADEEQWNIIKSHIEASDYYVVIIAHRYGSTTADGLSYTEKEYDYALSMKIPVLGFIIDEKAPWPNDRRDQSDEAENMRKLVVFKEKASKKPVGFWAAKDDLYGKVAIALMKTMTAQPRVGWIHASGAQSVAAATELARLSKENADLRDALEVARKSSEYAARFTEIENALEHATFLGDNPANPLLMSFKNSLGVFDTVGEELVLGSDIDRITRTIATKYGTGNPPASISDKLVDCLKEFVIQGIVARTKESRAHPFGDQPFVVGVWTLTELGKAFLRHRRHIIAKTIPPSHGE